MYDRSHWGGAEHAGGELCWVLRRDSIAGMNSSYLQGKKERISWFPDRTDRMKLTG